MKHKKNKGGHLELEDKMTFSGSLNGVDLLFQTWLDGAS